MSNQSTIDALRAMRFSGMASELERVIHSCGGGERAQCTILDTLRQTAIRTVASPVHNGLS